LKALFTGIYGLFTGTPTPAINTNVSARLYLSEAPQGTSFPYIVYYLVANDYDHQFGEDYEDCLIQFNIFDDKASASNISTYFENLKALYDWASPDVTNYTVVRMQREFAQLNKDDDVWQYTVQYRVLLEKN
jgi:hypothetical protein